MLSQEHLTALGQITLAFSRLEAVVRGAIILMLGPETSVGYMVCAQLSFQRSVDLLGSLIHHRIEDQNLIAQLDQSLRTASRAEARRNQIVHSEWWPADESDRPLRMKSSSTRKVGLKHQLELMTPDDLKQIAEEIEASRDEIGSQFTELAIQGVLPGVSPGEGDRQSANTD